MAAVVRFNISLSIENPELFPELAERAKDLRPVFEDIVQKWARNNAEKFQASVGMEASGSQVDPTVFWEGLKPATSKAKRRQGYSDQIMVATGALKMALEDEHGFFTAMTQQEVFFGTPKSLDDENKVRYNWAKRPTIFLGAVDQKNIEGDLKNYFEFGEGWKDIMFARGMANLARKNEMASMDMAFEETVAQ